MRKVVAFCALEPAALRERRLGASRSRCADRDRHVCFAPGAMGADRKRKTTHRSSTIWMPGNPVIPLTFCSGGIAQVPAQGRLRPARYVQTLDIPGWIDGRTQDLMRTTRRTKQELPGESFLATRLGNPRTNRDLRHYRHEKCEQNQRPRTGVES